VVERRSLAGELFLSCARPAADGWPLMWVNRPLQVNQHSITRGLTHGRTTAKLMLSVSHHQRRQAYKNSLFSGMCFFLPVKRPEMFLYCICIVITFTKRTSFFFFFSSASFDDSFGLALSVSLVLSGAAEPPPPPPVSSSGSSAPLKLSTTPSRPAPLDRKPANEKVS